MSKYLPPTFFLMHKHRHWSRQRPLISDFQTFRLLAVHGFRGVHVRTYIDYGCSVFHSTDELSRAKSMGLPAPWALRISNSNWSSSSLQGGESDTKKWGLSALRQRLGMRMVNGESVATYDDV